MFFWLGIALVAAAMVFLLASVVTRADDRSAVADAPLGLRGFWRDFRAGLARLRAGRQPVATERLREPEPVDTSIDEFFAAVETTAPAYVDAEELTDVLHRARARAAHTLHARGASHDGGRPGEAPPAHARR